jgi:hypothetical protein
MGLDASMPVPLRDLAIVSCGGPHLLARAIDAWREHLHAQQRACRIFVADDTRPGPGLAAQRSAGAQVAFFGIEQRRQLADRVCARTGVDPELAALALLDPEHSGYTLGANLNGILLATAGRAVLCVDQDIDPIVHRSPRDDGSTRLTHEQPIAHWWYANDPEAVAFRACCDIVGEHAAWLGRGLSERDGVDIETDDASLRARLDGGAHVIATWMGVVGHLGFSDARTIALEHADLERVTDPARLAAILDRPRALRCAPRCTLGPGRDFTSAITAYDGRVLLPPFFPIGRGIDLVFGLVAAVCRNDALFAHLPWALAHDRPTAGIASGDPRLNLAAALCELVMRAATSVIDRSPSERMAALGRRLVDLASVPPGAFAMLLRSVDMAVRRARIAQLQARIDERPTACAWWITQMQERIDALSRPPPSPSVPRELCSEGRSAAEGLRQFQRLVAGYGRILGAWPSLVAAATEIDMQELTT